MNINRTSVRHERPPRIPDESVEVGGKLGECDDGDYARRKEEDANLNDVDQVLKVIDQPEIGASTVAVRILLRPIVNSGDQAIVLSQLLYWYAPGQDRRRRLRVYKHGKMWIAKSYKELGQETGLDERQVRQAVDALVNKKFVERGRYKFGGKTMCHLRVVGSEVQKALNDVWEETQ